MTFTEARGLLEMRLAARRTRRGRQKTNSKVSDALEMLLDTEAEQRARIEAALAVADGMDNSVEHHTDHPCPKCYADDVRKALTGGREK